MVHPPLQWQPPVVWALAHLSCIWEHRKMLGQQIHKEFGHQDVTTQNGLHPVTPLLFSEGHADDGETPDFT